MSRRVAMVSAAASVFAFIAIGKLIADSESPFLYFQF